MHRDSWFQDYDGYLDDQYQKQNDEEREQYETEQAIDKYKQEKYK